MKKGVIIILTILGIIIILFFAIFVNHKIQLKRETKLLAPIGQMVEVDRRSRNWGPVRGPVS